MNKYPYIKYLIFDLDDTLLRKDRTLSTYTIETLSKAKKQGFKIVFNTSRSVQHSQKYADMVHPDYGIYSGGCHIVDKDNNDLFVNTIASKDVKVITKYLFDKFPKISVQSKDTFYASDKDYKAQNAQWVDFTNGLEVDAFKILCFSYDMNFVQSIADKYNLEFQNYVGGGWNRLSIKGATKWNGVLKLMEILHEDPKSTACFGDDVGDLEMIEKSGLGVAMKNSRPEVLKKAKNIALSSNEDGCAHFIEENLLD